MAVALEKKIALELQEVSFIYPSGQEALRNITLSIGAGEKIVLLGANGCGKSTLIKLLNGLVFPTSGTFNAFGERIDEAKLHSVSASLLFRRRIGFVFQNSEAQLFCPTVQDELAFAPLQMGLSPTETTQRIHDVANLLRIMPLLERTPHTLSGGEKRRVALGCILTMNPDVLLLDEPTNGLDPRSQQELIALLEQLHQSGKTLVTTTHDLSLVPRLADRVVIMSESHEIASIQPPSTALSDQNLLRRVNLIA